MTNNFFSAVFFDMDGLFVDSEPLWLEAETELMRDANYEWTHADQVACLGGPLNRVGQYMSDKSGGKFSGPEYHEKIIDLMVEKLSTAVSLMPGSLELAQELSAAGVPTALVSASPRIIVDAVFENISNHGFHFSISADDVIETKPNPACYLKAAEKFEVDIADCLIFEDSLTGIAAGRSSGATVIAVPHFVEVSSGPRLYVAKSLADLSVEKLLSFR